MSMSSEQQQMPMLTLSVGGVSFCLTPTSVAPTTNASFRFLFHPAGGQGSSGLEQQQEPHQNDESVYCMALESFTGTLRIQVKNTIRAPLTPPIAIATSATATNPFTTTAVSEQNDGEQQQPQQHGPSSLAISTAETVESPLFAATAKVTPKPGSSETLSTAAASLSSSPRHRQDKNRLEGEISELETAESSPMAAEVSASTTTAATGINATASASLPSLSPQEKQQQPDHSLKRISLLPDETRDDSSLFKRQKCSDFHVNHDDEDDDDDVDEDASNHHHHQTGGSLSQSSTLLAQEDLTQTQFPSQMEHDEYSPNLLETPPPPNDESTNNNDDNNNNNNSNNNNNNHYDKNGGDNTATSSSSSQCLRTILENNHSRDSSTTSAFSTTSSRTNSSTPSTSKVTSTKNSSILDEEQDGSDEEEDEEKEGSTEMDQEPEKNKNDNGAETKTSQEEEETETSPAGLDSPRTAHSTGDSPERSIVSRSPLQQQSTQQPRSLPVALSLCSEEASPCPRWGHTMTDLGDGRLLVYGGQTLDTKTNEFAKTLNDLYVYNMREKKWYRERFNGGGGDADSSGDTDLIGGLPRQWHTATFLSDRNLLICLGGEAANPKTGKTKTTDPVMVLDTEIMVWYPPVVSGDIPSGRSGHTTSLLVQSQNNGTRKTEELVLFGGIRGQKWLNSVSVLNTQTWVWKTPRLQGMAPRPRSYHSATAIFNRIVIFGGNNAEQSFNTVHVLEQNVDTADGNTTWRWTHPNVRGHPPKPRTGHSATLLADQKTICIFGGWDFLSDDDADDEDFIFQDSFLLDTEKWEWKPGPVIVDSSSTGSDQDDGNTTSYTKRVGHSAVLAVSETDTNGQKVMIFGGRAPGDRFTSDFKSLQLDDSVFCPTR